MCSMISENWDEYVPVVLYSHRISLQRSTGFSPFEMMFGREPLLPADIVLELDKRQPVDPNSFAD